MMANGYRLLPVFFVCILMTIVSMAQVTPPQSINGVFPKMAVVSGMADRSEAGIGALMNWANKLWAVGYVAHIKGSGPGLYEISDDMTMRKHPASYTGTYANRFIHEESLQVMIGPYLIDTTGNVRILDDLKKERLTATIRHLTKPDSMVYYLTMEGLFYETNVYTLKSRRLYDLVEDLKIPKDAQVHFKGAFTEAGKVFVANNSYYEEDFSGKRQAGRLAEWDGSKWTILDRNPYVEIAGKHWSSKVYGSNVYATGWDKSSVILKFLKNGVWKTYRLPKASYAYDHAWNTEWMRIREANTERYLMDAHGIFYELPTISYGGNIMGIRPISNHLRMVPDFISWRGMFVMASDQADHSSGQPQSGLWFGNMDELWHFGKPKGVGGPWYETAVKAGDVSDPYLMNGFDKKTVHLTNHGASEIVVTVEVDYLSNNKWSEYKKIKISPGKYAYHVFEDGFSAQWIRAKVNAASTVTVQFIYN
jgi:hypothetical protein